MEGSSRCQISGLRLQAVKTVRGGSFRAQVPLLQVEVNWGDGSNVISSSADRRHPFVRLVSAVSACQSTLGDVVAQVGRARFAAESRWNAVSGIRRTRNIEDHPAGSAQARLADRPLASGPLRRRRCCPRARPVRVQQAASERCNRDMGCLLRVEWSRPVFADERPVYTGLPSFGHGPRHLQTALTLNRSQRSSTCRAMSFSARSLRSPLRSNMG